MVNRLISGLFGSLQSVCFWAGDFRGLTQRSFLFLARLYDIDELRGSLVKVTSGSHNCF